VCVATPAFQGVLILDAESQFPNIRDIISNVRTRLIISSTTNRSPAVTLAAESLEAYGFEARQVFELPRVKLEVTEHHAWSARCSCGRRHQAEFPEPLGRSAVWACLKAFVVYLHHHHMVPAERTADILESVCGVRPSGGTVLNFVEEVAFADRAGLGAHRTSPAAHAGARC